MKSSEALKRAKKKYYKKNRDILEKVKNTTPEEKIIENLKEIIKNLLPNA